MPAKLDVLQVGYTRIIELDTKSDAEKAANPLVRISSNHGKLMKAIGSCCLVRSGTTHVLFDTMGPWEKDLLIQRLADLKIHPDDIQYVICSHHHPDHAGNLNLFTNAKKHFVGTSSYVSDAYDTDLFEPCGSYTHKSSKIGEQEIVLFQPYILDSGLRIEPTQGHTMECVSLIIDNCDKYGTVALAGDLFENENDVEDDSIWLMAGSQNPEYQRANRDRIYNMVDYIVPGHGPIFKTLGPLIKE